MFRARSFSLRAPYLGGLVSHLAAVVARAGLPNRDFRLRLSVGWPLFLPAGRRWSALLARSILQSARGLQSHIPYDPGSHAARRIFCEAPRLAVVALRWGAGHKRRPQCRHRVGLSLGTDTESPLVLCPRRSPRLLKHSMCAPWKGRGPKGSAEDGTHQHVLLIQVDKGKEEERHTMASFGCKLAPTPR